MQVQSLPNANSEDSIVMLHGWACGPSDFRFQVQHFKKNYSLLLPNYSTCPITDIPTNVNSLEWVAAQVLTAIQRHATGKVYIVGHSMGGAIALLLSKLAPELFSGVMIIDASLFILADKRERFMDIGKAILTDQGHQVMSDFIDNHMINHDLDDLAIMQSKKQEMLSVHAHSKDLLARLITDFAKINYIPAIKKLQHGVYVAAQTPRVERKEIEKLNQHIIFKQVKTSGHFVSLNAAAELNTIITDSIL